MPNYINKIKLPNNDVYEIQDANALPKTTQINGTSADSSTGNYTLTGDDIKLSSSYVVPQSYTPPVAGVTSVEDSIANLVKHVDDAVAGSVTSVDEAQDSHLDITTTSGAVTVDVADGYVIPSTTVGTPASGGTDVSLVSTGNMYTWNDKQSGITMDIPDTVDPEQIVTTRIVDGNKNTKLVGGTAVTLTPDTTNGTITINSSDTTYSDFVGSGTGHAAGLVPDPGAEQGTAKFLCENGTWATPVGKDYTAGTGIDISNADVIANTGVLNVTGDNTGSTAANGTVTITKLDNGSATESQVAVKGLAGAAYKGVVTEIPVSPTDNDVPTSQAVTEYVTAAIAAIPEPMVFKGSITLTADSTDPTKCSITVSGTVKKGYTYKVTSIATSPEYTGTIRVGDTFIADKASPETSATWTEGTDWTVIPSGDDEGKTYPCFVLIPDSTDPSVNYIGIDYGDLVTVTP